MTTHPSQCNLILARLQQSHGNWVSVTDLHQASGSYVIATRVSNLRAMGIEIENKTVRANDGRQFSFYKLKQ